MTERFVRVPEELLHGLARMRLTGGQAAVAAALLANLYRWPDTRERLSASYLAAATGLARRTVRRALDDLAALGVVAIGPTRRGSRPGLIEFRPAEAWAPAPEPGAPVRHLTWRTGAPCKADAPGHLPGAPVRHAPGAPVRHKVRERELPELTTPPRGTTTPGACPELTHADLMRAELVLVEQLPESEFRTVRMRKVRRQLADLADAALADG